MAETVQITLGANTTGAINAIRNFTAVSAQATSTVNKMAVALSNLGSNAATISSALGNKSLAESITKWNDLGTSIAFAGKAIAETAKGAAGLVSRFGARAGLAGAAVGLLSYMGLSKFQEMEAKQQLEESIKNVDEFNQKMAQAINDTILLKVKAGAITAEVASQLGQRASDAIVPNQHETLKNLVALSKEVNSGIGNREAAKAGLLMNEYELGNARSAGDQIKILEERIKLTRDLQQTYPGAMGRGGVSALEVPGANASEEDLKNYKELLATQKEIAQAEREIAQIRSESSFFLNDLTATAAGSVTTALSGVADGLTGIIMGTRTWAQAMQQTTASILNMVIQLILKFTVLYGLISILQAVFPGSGFVGKFAGFAGFPGKATGGLVGSGMYQVGEKGPEYVIDNKTLNRMGTGFFQSLQHGVIPNVASVPRGMTAAGGGAVGGAGSPPIEFHVYQSMEEAMIAATNSKSGNAHILNLIDGRIQMSRA